MPDVIDQVDVPAEGEAALTDEQLSTAFPGQDLAHIKAMMGTGTGETAPTEPAETVEYPDYIPEKYRNGTIEEAQAATAKGYSELSTKLGTTPEPTEPASDEAGEPEAGEGGETEGTEGEPALTSLREVEQAYVKDGQISEDIYVEFEGKGMPRDTLDAYIVGQQAIADQLVTSVHTEAGGPDQYTAMVEWAKVNWDKSEVAAYDAIVNKGDKGSAIIAVRGLKAAFVAVNGSGTSLLTGDGKTAGAVQGYQSSAEMTADMRDPRYKKDPAFRKSVEEKVGISDIW